MVAPNSEWRAGGYKKSLKKLINIFLGELRFLNLRRVLKHSIKNVLHTQANISKKLDNVVFLIFKYLRLYLNHLRNKHNFQK